MKKILTILLTIVMTLTLLTGCSNSVYDDFENFLNVEMAEVNENYEKIKSEAGRWESIETDAELEKSLKDVLLPLIDNSLEILEKINPETDEVKEVKNKYVKVMEAYKEGFSKFLEGVQELDEAKMLAGNEKIDKALELLEEYNTALENLANEVGAEIEY